VNVAAHTAPIVAVAVNVAAHTAPIVAVAVNVTAHTAPIVAVAVNVAAHTAPIVAVAVNVAAHCTNRFMLIASILHRYANIASFKPVIYNGKRDEVCGECDM